MWLCLDSGKVFRRTGRFISHLAKQPVKPMRSLPLLLTSLIIIAIAYVNADGYHNEWRFRKHPWKYDEFVLVHPGYPEANALQAESINWLHGWPLPFVGRQSIYSLQKGKGVPLKSGAIAGPTGRYSRWPIDNAPTFRFRPTWLALDLALAGLMVSGTVYSLFHIRNWKRARFQFGIRHAFSLITAVAICVAFRAHLPSFKIALDYSALGLIVVGSLLAVAAFLVVTWRSIRCVSLCVYSHVCTMCSKRNRPRIQRATIND